MKIAVFGATGGIGKHVVNHALKEGYEVKAYVRNKSKYNKVHEKLSIVEGQLHEFNKIIDFVSNVDVVLSALGSSMDKSYNSFPVLEGHINILKAMELKGLRRFMTIGTPSLTFKADQKSLYTQLAPKIGKKMFPNAIRELVSIGHVIKQSTLDWTVVRYMMPVDEDTGEIKVGFGKEKLKWKISRENIAKFMVNEVKENKYIQSMPIIGS